MAGFLPRWATLAEAEQWLAEETGEPWPLPRLIEAGCRVHAWIDPPAPDHAARQTFLKHVFEGRAEGYMAEFTFSADTNRIGADRTAVMSVTRTPSGKLVWFDPPIPVDLASLRFSRDDLKDLATAVPGQVGPQVKRAELIDRNLAQWPTIKRDLDEVSRGSAWLAPAKAEGGRWYEGTALALARANGRIVTPADPATLQSWVHRAKRGG